MLHHATQSTDSVLLEPEAGPSTETASGDGWHWWISGEGENQVKTLAFRGCWVHLHESARYLHTSYADGHSLWSVPVYEKDILTARAYGYGEDALSLWREHDILHHRVAAAFGHDTSPTIWSECHNDDPRALPSWARREEEVFVAHVHRWLNQNLWHDDLWAFQGQGHDTQAIHEDFKRLLLSLRW